MRTSPRRPADSARLAHEARLNEAFPPALEEQLRRLWALDGEPYERVAAEFEQEPDDLLAGLSELLDIGLFSVTDGTVRMTPPYAALTELLASESVTLQATIDRMLRMGGIVARLGGESPRNVSRPRLEPDESWLDAQVLRGLPSAEEFRAWVDRDGDLRFLRPRHWRLPSDAAMAAAFAQVVARGHSVRCIYPTEALRLARSTLDTHVEFGEQVRLMPDVSHQLGLVGTELALLVSGMGDATRTVVLRDRVLVAVLVDYFDRVWDEAVVMPPEAETWDREDERQMLLAELGRGARDEQIAKTLGISLRTVRRRVADLMVEFEAETRFQVGAEAVRRGWL